MKKIISLDLGTKTGWAYLNLTNKDDYSLGGWYCKGYKEFGSNLKKLLDLYKPDLLVCSQTNSFGYYSATRKMFMLFGVACYIAEKKGLPVVEFNDSSARKFVFNKGNLKKRLAHEELFKLKPEMAQYGEDELDAFILALGWEINQKKNG